VLLATILREARMMARKPNPHAPAPTIENRKITLHRPRTVDGSTLPPKGSISPERALAR
jgi:hypothetical protein